MEENIEKDLAQMSAYITVDGITNDFFARIHYAQLQLRNAHYTEQEAKEIVYKRACSALQELEVNLLKYYSEEEN